MRGYHFKGDTCPVSHGALGSKQRIEHETWMHLQAAMSGQKTKCGHLHKTILHLFNVGCQQYHDNGIYPPGNCIMEQERPRPP